MDVAMAVQIAGVAIGASLALFGFAWLSIPRDKRPKLRG